MKKFKDEIAFLVVTKQFSALRSAGYSASALRSAGYSASALRSAGYSASDVLSAGYSASALRSAGYSASALRSAPKLYKPYTKLNDDLKKNRRKFNQRTFGEEEGHRNPCGTPMCIAGHLVSLAGDKGWELRKKLGFPGAAALIHAAAHPKIPCPNFGGYSDELALGFIRHMAKLESKKK